MQLKAKRQTKKHMKQKTKVNKKNIRSKNTQRRIRNKRRTKKKRSHKGGTYYSDCKAILKNIFLELEGENDTKYKPNNKLIYRKLKNRETLSQDDEDKIEKYIYYTNIPSKEQKETIDQLIKVVEERKKMSYKPKQIIQSYDMDLTTDMLEHFKIYGFLNKNKLSEKMNHLEKCKYTEFELAKYERSGSRSYKNVHISGQPENPREVRFYKNVRVSGYLIDKEMPISTFLSKIKDIYAIQTSGIEQLKDLIEQYNPDNNNLIQNIEKYNPDNNNLTQDIDLTKNTKKWMELFESCLKVLNDVKTQKNTYDGYESTNTAVTDPLTDEE